MNLSKECLLSESSFRIVCCGTRHTATSYVIISSYVYININLEILGAYFSKAFLCFGRRRFVVLESPHAVSMARHYFSRCEQPFSIAFNETDVYTKDFPFELILHLTRSRLHSLALL